MTYNFVTVNFSAVLAMGGTVLSAGSLFLQPDNLLVDSSSGTLVVTPPITLSGGGSYTGTENVPLLATDNATITAPDGGPWHWLIRYEYPGIYMMNWYKAIVAYTNGATQSFYDILAAAAPVSLTPPVAYQS